LVSPLLTSTSMTVLQEKSPPEMLGRVMGLASVLLALTGPVGLVALAPVADHLSIRWVLIVPGALALIGTLLASRRAPEALAPATGREA
jgi:MFS family permease